MPNFTTDYFLGHNGKTYCLPLISVNQNLGSWAQSIDRKKERVDLLNYKKKNIHKLLSFVQEYSIKPAHINAFLQSINSSELKHGCKLHDLLLRPQFGINEISEAIPTLKNKIEEIPEMKEEIIEAAEVMIKYQG
jgi:tRNA uridine 5-carboxymethylaminomethyl modification enzyme